MTHSLVPEFGMSSVLQYSEKEAGIPGIGGGARLACQPYNIMRNWGLLVPSGSPGLLQ